MNSAKKLSIRKTALEKYFFYSVIVAIVDTGIVWALLRFSLAHLVVANTIGVITGFVLHYMLASKSVFNTKYGLGGFVVYLGTFIAGLGFANWLIYISYHHIFMNWPTDLRILLSKGVSIALPFFAMYFARKYLFLMINRKG
ncbi:MAG: GtrA family protein [Eubacteriales bacterium]|nr:GtrA family protein [Eubacteriales bacterium]MDD3349729.1 GtrA family protein [Eubacteriales bacterium]